MSSPSEIILETPLHAAHVALGGRMVPFAGYAMPVQYPSGILAEHRWTRENAGLFDVSHMGQCFLAGPDHDATAAALESLVAADILGLKPGQQRYSQLLTADGGIIDDLMVFRSPDPADNGTLGIIVNASRKEVDYDHIAARLPDDVQLIVAEDRALLALQGPKAQAVLARLGTVLGPASPSSDIADMPFMAATSALVGGIPVGITRSGYTGEDGFELSVPTDRAVDLWTLLLTDGDVRPIGLGARDSLRLEGGLCLYGHELDETVSIVEGAIEWSVQKRRRHEGGFPGFSRFARELAEGPARRRVGILPEGRAPAREGTEIRTPDGETIGIVTSGGFGPTIDGPVAMGFVPAHYAAPGTPLQLIVRGKPLVARVVALPFVPSRFKRIKS